MWLISTALFGVCPDFIESVQNVWSLSRLYGVCPGYCVVSVHKFSLYTPEGVVGNSGIAVLTPKVDRDEWSASRHDHLYPRIKSYRYPIRQETQCVTELVSATGRKDSLALQLKNFGFHFNNIILQKFFFFPLDNSYGWQFMLLLHKVISLLWLTV